ncbi:MAG: twin-arginine translocase TatA/TatE family subunit, partial [Actinobacteria bacterium]|nr:twin-arginine translocase TatA/TatE family subunit [Actinomycetota bacterium]
WNVSPAGTANALSSGSNNSWKQGATSDRGPPGDPTSPLRSVTYNRPRRIADLGRSLGRGVRDFKLEFDRDKKDKELGGDEDPDAEQNNSRRKEP